LRLRPADHRRPKGRERFDFESAGLIEPEQRGDDVGAAGDAGLKPVAGLGELLGRETAALTGGVDLLSGGDDVELYRSDLERDLPFQVAPARSQLPRPRLGLGDATLAAEAVEDRNRNLEAPVVGAEEPAERGADHAVVAERVEPRQSLRFLRRDAL